MTQSLQVRLSFFLSLAIVVAAVGAGAFTFQSAYREAYELQDDVLRQVATLMDRQRLAPTSLVDSARQRESDEASDVIVQRLDGNAAKDGDLPLGAALASGLHTVAVGDKTYRVLVHAMSDGTRIAVAQDGGFRDQIAYDAARRSLAPFAILLPVLLLIVAVLVRGLIQPIFALAREIDRRDERDLRAVSEDRAPAEIGPFVAAINRLLARLGRALEEQRRFVADAAHELRSPMTALLLQAEALEKTDLPHAAREKLAELRLGVARGRRLIDQLLSLAQAQSTPERVQAPISIHHVFRKALEILLPLAEAKGIDIGVDSEQDAWALADEIELTILVRNLIDNAIRYTPDGGRIDLSVEGRDNWVILSVRDTGPGIAHDERVRVFDPFYRVLASDETGSGLGLSIVKTIAERMGGNVVLNDGDHVAHKGLCVQVTLPSARSTARLLASENEVSAKE